MFGYVMINKGDLKVRELETYQSFYCGLCQKLKERYGLSGQLTLSYDLTFVVILLTGLYEPKVKKGTTHWRHPPIEETADPGGCLLRLCGGHEHSSQLL